MKIESILKREGGTHVELEGVNYHFEPVADGAHVADVAKESHIDRFLAIPEAFKLYHGKASPKGKPTEVEVQTLANVPAPEGTKPVGPLAGSDQLPPQFEIGGRIVTQLEAVQLAFEASGMTSDAWNELGDDERVAKIEIALDELADADEAGEGEGEESKTPAAPAAKPAAKKTTKKK